MTPLAAIDDQEAVLVQTPAEPSFINFIRAVGSPGTEPRPDPASLDYEAMNAMAGPAGQPVVGPPPSADEIAVIVAKE